MSTVIHDGLEFNMTLDEMVLFFKDLKPRISAITEKKQAIYLAESVVHKLDYALVKGEPISFYTAFVKVRDDFKADYQEVKLTGYRNPLVDFECHVHIYPYDGKLYGIISCDHKEVIKIIKKDPRVREFSYYDNADKPSRINKEEWGERSRIWAGAMKNGVSLSADLSKPYFQNCGIMATVIKNNFPSKEVRAHRVAEFLIVMPPDIDPSCDTFMYKYMEFMRSDEAITQMADTMARILPILPDTYE